MQTWLSLRRLNILIKLTSKGAFLLQISKRELRSNPEMSSPATSSSLVIISQTTLFNQSPLQIPK